MEDKNYTRKVRVRAMEWRLIEEIYSITNEGTTEERWVAHRDSLRY